MVLAVGVSDGESVYYSGIFARKASQFKDLDEFMHELRRVIGEGDAKK